MAAMREAGSVVPLLVFTTLAALTVGKALWERQQRPTPKKDKTIINENDKAKQEKESQPVQKERSLPSEALQETPTTINQQETSNSNISTSQPTNKDEETKQNDDENVPSNNGEHPPGNKTGDKRPSLLSMLNPFSQTQLDTTTDMNENNNNNNNNSNKTEATAKSPAVTATKTSTDNFVTQSKRRIFGSFVRKNWIEEKEEIPRELSQQFHAACQKVQKLPVTQLNNREKLQFYSYYKQATVGPCNTGAPSTVNLVAYQKYKVWKSLPSDMSKVDAMKQYIALAATKDSSIAVVGKGAYDTDDDDVDDVDEFLGLGGGGGMGLRPSRLVNEDSVDNNEDDDDDDENALGSIHSAARTNQLDHLKKLISQEGIHLDAFDSSGQTALHLAADRGHVKCVKLLLQSGANANAVDREHGISILQTAAIAEQIEICKVLLSFGADPDLADKDGETARSEAQDNPTIMALFKMPAVTAATSTSTNATATTASAAAASKDAVKSDLSALDQPIDLGLEESDF